jgi:hypothetical protein
MKNPVFIVGVDRSGTTLLTMMLDMHSQLWIPNESHFIVDYFEKYEGVAITQDDNLKRSIVRKIFDERYVRDWDISITADQVDVTACRTLSDVIAAFYQACATSKGKMLWGDKTPRYLVHVDVLNKLYPEARFIHIVRDGRDVAESISQMWWGANDFASALKSWERRVEMGHKMLNMLPQDRWIQLRFEDLVLDTKKELRRVTDFLQLPFEESMLGYASVAAEKVGGRIDKHHSGLMQAPQASETYRWKNRLSHADQALAWQIAGRMLKHFQYEEGVTKHHLRLVRSLYYSVLEIWNWRFWKKKFF